MILSLLWLTVSLPCVAKAKQLASTSQSSKSDQGNPLTNTTEEKAPQTLNEEYHPHEEMIAGITGDATRTYIPHICPDLPHYHSELISPPPEV